MVDNFIDTRVNIYFHLYTETCVVLPTTRLAVLPTTSCRSGVHNKRVQQTGRHTKSSLALDVTRSRLLPTTLREEVTGSPRLRGTAATFGRFFEDAARRAMSRSPPFICQESRVHRNRLPSGAAGLRSRSP